MSVLVHTGRGFTSLKEYMAQMCTQGPEPWVLEVCCITHDGSCVTMYVVARCPRQGDMAVPSLQE